MSRAETIAVLSILLCATTIGGFAIIYEAKHHRGGGHVPSHQNREGEASGGGWESESEYKNRQYFSGGVVLAVAALIGWALIRGLRKDQSE